MIKDFLKAAKTGCAMDFVANEGYKFTKEELIDLLKEAMFIIQSTDASPQLTSQFIQNVEENVAFNNPSWCEETLDRLNRKPKEEWTDEDYEAYSYAKGTLESEEAERKYLNGEE